MDERINFGVVKQANFGNPEGAERLREIADMVERGEIRDIVVCYDNHGEKHFASWGLMDDRWRLLGAIEYAKKYVMT